MAPLHARVSTHCCRAELAAAAYVVVVVGHQSAFAGAVDLFEYAADGPGLATSLRRQMLDVCIQT